MQRGLVRRLVRLPSIPSEPEWAQVLDEVAREGLRNRLMFALAYYGALRREELIGLRVSDFDVARRLISVRPETSKGSRARVVCYAAEASPALAAYFVRRRALGQGAGPMFLSESDRNSRQPLTKWTWSKVVERLARQAGVEGFSTHTLRHLRLTHLARAGWRLHEIATYAGHRNPQTTMAYLHLSGGDLLAKMAASVGHLDAKLGAAARAQDKAVVNEAGSVTPAGTLCYLDVPAGKTFRAYTKPVALAVKERIDAWAAVRPEQGTVEDEVTGERAHMVFQIRGRPIGSKLLNGTIIPMLCAKAGLPPQDTTGAITSHRGRASAVTALASAPQGMTLSELMAWCGHSNPKSTMHYIRVRPTRLAGAFAKADRMAHMVRVLIDQEAVLSGAARDGAPWKFYDLGHSYCTNAFWSTCPHRMACAGCSFNLPKDSAKAMAVEARASVARLLEEVPLSPDERAAAEGDMAALDGMLAKLREVPALDGRTPQEIDFDHDRAT